MEGTDVIKLKKHIAHIKYIYSLNETDYKKIIKKIKVKQH
ncbi:Uncharacterised protein [Clostridium botulinum]|nr:Uncharacterised protein [Clostridium botulinum]